MCQWTSKAGAAVIRPKQLITSRVIDEFESGVKPARKLLHRSRPVVCTLLCVFIVLLNVLRCMNGMCIMPVSVGVFVFIYIYFCLVFQSLYMQVLYIV